MPLHLYWGEDDYQIHAHIHKLRQKVLDRDWQDFNYQVINASGEVELNQGLAEALTPPFGAGDRLTWLNHVSIWQKCSDATLEALSRTLQHLPPNSHLVLTGAGRPDSRLKVTKLLQQYGEWQECNPIPAWKPELIAQMIKQQADGLGLALSAPAIDYLVSAVGGDLRRMDMELQKLAIAHRGYSKPLTVAQVQPLVLSAAGNSLQLAQAIKNGQLDRAIQLLGELIHNNEAGLRICATLVGQFRTWVLVKSALAQGEKDDAVAKIADLGNPKRVYFLKQEVQNHSLEQWLATLPVLLELEANLKRGTDDLTALTVAIEQLHNCLRPHPP